MYAIANVMYAIAEHIDQDQFNRRSVSMPGPVYCVDHFNCDGVDLSCVINSKYLLNLWR